MAATSQALEPRTPNANRFTLWLTGVRARLRKPGWLVALVVPLVWWLLDAFAQDLATRVLGKVGAWLAALVANLLAEPTGIAVVIFLGVLLALIIVAFVESRPKEQQLRRLEERLQVAEGYEQFARNQIADDERMLRERGARIKELEQKLAEIEAGGTANFQKLVYGDELIEPASLNAADYAGMFARVEEMMPNIEAMLIAADRLWTHYRQQVGNNEGFDWLAQRIHEKELEQTRRTMELLRTLLQTHKDPRAGLVALFGRYCEWRSSIQRFAKVTNVHLYTMVSYTDWQKCDVQFFKDLQQRNSTSQFAAVRRAMKGYAENHEPIVPLPDPERDP